MAREYRRGDVILGNWTLVKELGQGSFGKVFEAHRDEFGSTYKAAIKIITIPYSQSEISSARAEGMDDESIRAYFQGMVTEIVQEFALMSRLKGTAHVVSYEDHSVVLHQNGIGWDVFIRMELLTPLLDHMNQHQMTHSDIIKLGIDVCKALEICQRHNIIHRDIKPENLFVNELGDVKLGDFGIARTVEKTTGGLSRKGTYTYMAPEVYREDAYGSSVDIYSLGIVLYRLLNHNRSPFLPLPPHNISHSDRELALIRRMSGEPLPKPARAGERLSSIVLKCCAYDPKERYTSAGALRKDLEAMLLAVQHTGAGKQPVNPKRSEPHSEYTSTRRTNRGTGRPSGTINESVTARTMIEHSEGGRRPNREGKVASELPRNSQPRKVSGKREGQPVSKKNHSIWPVVAIGALICVLVGGFFVFKGRKNDEAIQIPPITTQATEAEQTLPPQTEDEAAKVEELSMIVTNDSISQLDQYPNLRKLDLTGSTCYEAIQEYELEHPSVDVSYSVSLGGIEVDKDAAALSLSPADFTYEELKNNLRFLPAVTTISYYPIELTGEQIQELRSLYPNVKMDYAVTILGESIGLDRSYLDLSAMTDAQTQEIAKQINLLPELVTADLNTDLSLESVAILQDANPNVEFKYAFELYGKIVSLEDSTVEFKDVQIGNEGETLIRQALAVLDNCERFVLDNCGLDDATLAKIREDFRDGPKVVWRVYFGQEGRYNTLTDDDTVRAVYNVTDETCGPLQYLEDVKYMDLGHNDHLSDFSFIRYMPELEVLIASGTRVQHLDGFENCKKLTWLEFAYCEELTDISSLSQCDGLKYLNISNTNVNSLSALQELPLERFVYLNPMISEQEREAFVEAHPKETCISVFYGYEHPYGYGWRYDDNGKTMFWYYKDVIRKVFNYDQADAMT